jgi:hypothetical protein
VLMQLVMFCWTGELEAEENVILKQLHSLIGTTCEYLGLWKILCDHQFHIIVAGLTAVCNSSHLKFLFKFQ